MKTQEKACARRSRAIERIAERNKKRDARLERERQERIERARAAAKLRGT